MSALKRSPSHLLLATDLSARSDRAIDRAIALARAWHARLTVLHVLDELNVQNDQPSRPALAGAQQRAMRILRDDLADADGIRIDLLVKSGHPGDVILEAAKQLGCDFVVTGIAGNAPMGQSLLGSTVTKVTRHASAPVLVVKQRARTSYRQVTVATDFSPASGSALDLALELFEVDQLSLFHAYDAPYRPLTEEPEAYSRECARLAIRKAQDFLEEAGIPDQIEIVVLEGDVGRLIANHAAAHGVDLIVTGTHGKSGIAHLLVGSVVSAILDEAPCDILVAPSIRKKS
ncbi:universal stress protein [Shinella sp. S4-D37]|uniref:universal stress protein n=1 Tax=Shinella sp. S4-D37 TaxID=3161999 RepID=UPI003467D85E